ncbi:MAG: glycolate oxidase, partial [Pseudonocardiales bacterium]|nr:glycolate oxidase [Pseudonocardiales bacterium]
MSLNGTAQRDFERALGVANVISDPPRLRSYECDGLTGYRVVPALVLLPKTAEQVAAAVRVCAAHGIPFVARGAGTGLSGGALPVADGVVISLQRLRRVLEVDPVDRRAVLEPGVTNLDITRAAAPYGLYYAPDPSSQQVCTIGGNVAENSGGAHCLKYGFTTNHVLALEVVLADGSVVTLGGDSGEQLGPDLRGVLLGSEGTVGIATKITVRLLRAPETVRTLLADFPSIEAAGEVVSDIVAAGIVPAATISLTTSPAPATDAKSASSVRTVSGVRNSRTVILVAIPTVPSEPTVTTVPSGSTTCAASTWWVVKPYLRQCAPPEFSATLPPIVHTCWLE